MKIVLNLVLFVVLFVGVGQVSAQSAGGRNGADGGTASQYGSPTDIATLFALDPLAQSLCFKDGRFGAVFQNGQTRNRCSDLNFNSYTANSFSVGVEGGRQGVIIDLGTPRDLQTKFGYSETVGSGQGFASIDVKNGKALILKDYKTGELQELLGAAELFTVQPRSTASAPVKLGHVYLMRVTDVHDKSYEMFAKILVVAHVPNESVTVRWSVISNDATAKL